MQWCVIDPMLAEIFWQKIEFLLPIRKRRLWKPSKPKIDKFVNKHVWCSVGSRRWINVILFNATLGQKTAKWTEKQNLLAQNEVSILNTKRLLDRN